MKDCGSNGVDIVIPNWNGKKMLETCLSSLRRQSVQNFRVTVVDNGSEDNSVAFLKEHYPEVDVVSFPLNRGFSVAVNKGIENGNLPLVLLLNNDTELDERCVEELLKQSTGETGYDMFALKMLSFVQRSILDGAGDGVLRGGVGYRLGTMEKDSPSYNLKKDVFGACAGAALYRRSMFDKIGLFDEDFFAYLEDVDFNMRAVRSGYNCLYIPKAVVYHIGSASSGSKINDFTVKLSTRNNIFVLIKNYSATTFFRFLPALLIYQFFWLVFVIKKRQLFAYISGIFSCLPLIGAMMKKGWRLRKKSILSDSDFREKISRSERTVISSIMNRREQQGKSNKAFTLYLRLLC
jgi:GT2 family glycosyltransferase